MTNADHRQLPGPIDYDAELHRHDGVLRRACAIGPRDHVVDIGCGTGHVTRHAARLARTGAVLGVDVSPAAIERARQLARADQLHNVTFECADAEVHRFAPGRFDAAISRFGTMFFTDPTAAFTNIGRALRADGRLVMMVWQAADRNEWDVAIRTSLGGTPDPPALDPAGPDAFSLADPALVTRSWRRLGSRTSPALMSASPSTTARTRRRPSSGCAASPAPAARWRGSPC